MTRPESEYRPESKAAHIIRAARKFTDRQYPLNGFGLTIALTDLQNQYLRTRLTTPRPEVVRLVRSRAPIIEETANESLEASATGRYAEALRTANMLHGYAEVDMEERLGGEAVNLSLNAHRTLLGLAGLDPDAAERVTPELRRIAAAVQAASYEGEREKEYGLVRKAVHTMVLDGILGEEAKEHWDPYAVIKTD
jgi:hypothetical protein